MLLMRSPLRSLARLTRLAALIVWAAQLGVVAAPLADARAGASAAPHVEPYGTRLHYAHTPDVCVACAAYALIGRPEPAHAEPAVAAGRRERVPEGREQAGHAPRLSAARPRAPPA